MATCNRGGVIYKRHQYDLIEGVCRKCGKEKKETGDVEVGEASNSVGG